MNNAKLFFKNSRFSPVFLLFYLSLAISFITRVILFAGFSRSINASFLTLSGSFIIGFLYDAITGLLLIIPFVLHICFTNDFIYTKKGKWFAIAFFLIALFLFLFTRVIPREFNKDLYNFSILYIVLRFLIFAFLYNSGISFRYKWRSAVLKLFFCITLFLLLFNGISEWFFWDEFGSRYNFIAVDYLIYTNEVVGNIRESYPITRIIVSVLLCTLIIYRFAGKLIARSVRLPMSFTRRVGISFVTIALGLIYASVFPPQWKYFSKNNYANELAGNGVYDFAQAFKANELNFYGYYRTLPDSSAFRLVRRQMENSYSHFLTGNLYDLRRQISYPQAEHKMNVVLISVESLSASFLETFGNTQHITPCLDSLAEKGLLFTNLYASGTRTVRGLEALSLSVPPLPGQSIVKRPGNENLFSLGSVFKNKGYSTQYIYGGYGYFDNMNYFFKNNGYEVIDRTALQKDEIHYENIWGVADEDLFTLTLRTLDKDYASGNPFFTHVMTVSNHRPFTYPEGRIDIPASAQSREGAVKYTDYAIGHFINEASKKAWFNNTLFVIVADHCASSAGKEELPLPGYHIPLIIYSPGLIKPSQIGSLMSQIDIAPTILGLLHFNYTTRFFGQDILNTPADKQRAFISTYHGLGFIKNDTLIIQTPVKKIKAYKTTSQTGNVKEIKGSDSLVNDAISLYQVMAWLIKNKEYTPIKNQKPNTVTANTGL
jgi:phosphoglycerol transferase MdoB-like AlkP superfamily enzyme